MPKKANPNFLRETKNVEIQTNPFMAQNLPKHNSETNLYQERQVYTSMPTIMQSKPAQTTPNMLMVQTEESVL